MMCFVLSTQDNIPGVRGIGPKIARDLLCHFHSVEHLYSTLGLNNVASVTQVGKLSRRDFEEILTVQGCETALQELALCLNVLPSSPKPLTLLNKLYATAYLDVLQYKRLVTLHEDLDISDCVVADETEGDKVSGKALNSQYFRYRGEDIRNLDRTFNFLNGISPSLIKPLNLLRMHYSKLDRASF